METEKNNQEQSTLEFVQNQTWELAQAYLMYENYLLFIVSLKNSRKYHNWKKEMQTDADAIYLDYFILLLKAILEAKVPEKIREICKKIVIEKKSVYETFDFFGETLVDSGLFDDIFPYRREPGNDTYHRLGEQIFFHLNDKKYFLTLEYAPATDTCTVSVAEGVGLGSNPFYEYNFKKGDFTKQGSINPDTADFLAKIMNKKDMLEKYDIRKILIKAKDALCPINEVK